MGTRERERAGRLVALAGVAAATLLAGTGSAFAALECGDTLTEDRTLKADLTCGTFRDGVKIGAAGVKVDLNGHTITGSSGLGEVGVRNPAGFDKTKVVGGTIRGFATSVLIDGGSGHTLSRVRMEGPAGAGVVLDGVSTTAVLDSRIIDPPFYGIQVAGASTSVTLAGNRLTSPGQLFGIDVAAASADVTVTANTISGPYYGVNFAGGGPVEVHDNVITDIASYAIQAHDVHFAMIEGNTIERVELQGINVNGEAERIHLVSNVVRDAAYGGINVEGNADGTRVVRNDVADTSVDGSSGISIAGNVDDVEVLRNLVSRAEQNGILVQNETARIARNEVTDNGDYGIFSFSSRGSANLAEGNGNPAQCLPPSLCVTP